MHKIEQAIQVFLENIETTTVSEELIEEFGENCKKAIRQCLLAKRSEEPFKLRMSNLGKPLRQLLLERLYGRSPMNAQMRLKMTYGYMWESFLVLLLKASGLKIETDRKVQLDINYDEGKSTTIYGMCDLKIDGEIYDTKSASSWAYDNKFISFSHMEADDPFGYCGQAFGYSLADKSRFAGWIVIDKSDGRMKVVEVPQGKYRELARKYLDDFKNKIRLVTKQLTAEQIDEIAPCTGVVEETFNKRATGNYYLNKSCEFCDCKYKCHPGLVFKELPLSKAVKKIWRYYVKLTTPSIPVVESPHMSERMSDGA